MDYYISNCGTVGIHGDIDIAMEHGMAPDHLKAKNFNAVTADEYEATVLDLRYDGDVDEWEQ